jgi:predicted MPP superfamily phosphohydrolase
MTQPKSEKAKRRRHRTLATINRILSVVQSLSAVAAWYTYGTDFVLWRVAPFLVCCVVLARLVINLPGWKSGDMSQFAFLVNVILTQYAVLSGLLYPLLLVQIQHTGLPAAIRMLLIVTFAWLHLSVYLHCAALSKPKLRPQTYRVLVSFPCSVGFSFIVLMLPVVLFYALLPAIAQQIIALGCFLISLAGLHSSLQQTPWKVLDFDLAILMGRSAERTTKRTEQHAPGKHGAVSLSHMDKPVRLSPVEVASIPRSQLRHYAEYGSNSSLTDDCKTTPSMLERKLRIVQLTDMHIGSFTTPDALAEICRQIVQLDPDLVLLTGDYFTPEGDHLDLSLQEGLAPLESISTRVFAITGNHDVESDRVFELVKEQLSSLGIRLLVDEEAVVETCAGPTQIIGIDWASGHSATKLAYISEKFPAQAGIPRIVLMHDPSAFRRWPVDDRCFMLSGHTHGGQVGLVSLGLNFTLLGATGRCDHGLWGYGENLLYINR